MPQYSSQQFETFVKKCIKISNEVSDKDNFVSIYKLANHFNANVELRPLLVEGMLATESGRNSIGNKNKWTVFIDSETYPNISIDNLNSESIDIPLPERMRNTVAHELVHTLAFQELEDGFKLTKSRKTHKSIDKFINYIESETEKLSPLLLISDLLLDRFFSSKKDNIDIHDLLQLKKFAAVSRYVLINRLFLLRKYDKRDICYRPPLRNMLIGIGAWKGKNNAVLNKWPSFLNFDGNIIPDFLSGNNDESSVPINNIFHDPAFYLLGGNSDSTTSSISFGTMNTRSTRNLNVKCIIEEKPRTNGKEFFCIIHMI
jgi:hypothetical protein